MLSKLKANILFHQLLKRPNIEKAYAMVDPTDPWYATITKVHQSLAQIRQLPHEVLELRSHDGLSLKGVYYPCSGEPKGAVIFAHGYTSHAEREWAFPGLFYRSLGFDVLIPYQRAHGPSGGKYITFGALEQMDMRGWVKRINTLRPDCPIVIHGLSMGGGIVLDLCDKEMQDVKCLIADAPNTNIEAFFRAVAGQVFKKDGDAVYECILEKFKKEFHVDAADFDAIKLAANSKYPIFLTAGSEEHQEQTLRSIQAACPTETQILILPGCNHGNGMYKQTQLYQNAIKGFLDKNLA